MSSNFDATVRRSGNSLVVTIPYNVAKAHNIGEGTPLNITIQKMGDKEEKKA